MSADPNDLRDQLINTLRLLMVRRAATADADEQAKLDQEADQIELAILQLSQASGQSMAAIIEAASATLQAATAAVRRNRAAAPLLLIEPAAPSPRDNGATEASNASSTEQAPLDDRAFVDMITALNLKYFKPYELLIMGSRHSDKQSPAFGLNTRPPQSLWRNIIPTVQVLDALRARLGAPIRITNAYRTAAYNRAIGGARDSQHVQFKAIDFAVEGNSRPTDWARALRSLRDDEKAFKGGVGLYDTFVHIDTRGHNEDW